MILKMVFNWKYDSPELLHHFDSSDLEEQRDNVYNMAKVEMDKKKSMSLERMVEVLGYEPENRSHIFMKLSEQYGGTVTAREHTYKMTGQLPLG